MTDLGTLANVAQAIAVIVAVAFGIVQVRQLSAQRRREAAFALMHSLQSPRVLRAILLIDRLPDAVAKSEIDALPDADQVDLIALLGTWESLGILVFNREVSLKAVDDFYSGTIDQSWRILGRYVEEVRTETSRATRWEWFQWLVERMRESEAATPRVPAHLECRHWSARQ